MSEKFRKVVKAPHRAFRAARDTVEKLTPTGKLGKVGRAGAWTTLGLFQFITWAIQYVALDNQLLRKMEKMLSEINVEKNKRGNPKWHQAFGKKYPNLSAHMMYYLMLGMVVGGGAGYKAIEDSHDADKTITQSASDDNDFVSIYDAETYGAYMEKMRSITPLLVAHLVSLEGVRMQNGMHVPYDDKDGHILKPGEKARGKATIGFGSTVLKDGKSVTSNTPPITKEEAYELVRHHLEIGETYFVLYCYETGMPNVHIDSTQKAMMLASMVYNMGSSLIEEKNDKNHVERFAALRDLYKQYGFAVSDEMVRDLFAKYPVTAPTQFGRVLLGIDKKHNLGNMAGMYLVANGKLAPGLVYRRWIEAGVLSGDIKPADLLNIPVEGLPQFYQLMNKKVNGDKKRAFFIEDGVTRRVNKETYADFQRWLENPVDKNGVSMRNSPKIRDVMPADIVKMCESGQCELGNIMAFAHMPRFDIDTSDGAGPSSDTPPPRSVQEATYVIGYDQMYDGAIRAFRNKEYANAAAQFESMIAAYPNNALLHNDLAATYNKLGRYDDAIRHARIVLHDIGDKSQYAAAQYNAGYAYEQKGNLQKALSNYKLAVSNGNRRAQKDVTRVANMLKANQNGRNKISQRMQYNAASKKLGNRAHSAKMNNKMTGHDGHDIA